MSAGLRLAELHPDKEQDVRNNDETKVEILDQGGGRPNPAYQCKHLQQSITAAEGWFFGLILQLQEFDTLQF